MSSEKEVGPAVKVVLSRRETKTPFAQLRGVSAGTYTLHVAAKEKKKWGSTVVRENFMHIFHLRILCRCPGESPLE